MKAAYIEEFGGNNAIKIGDQPEPIPAPGEVQIAVAYAGVNPVDWKLSSGYLKEVFECRFPMILGWDAAGTIAAVGDGVTDWQVGDEVYALCRKEVVQYGTFCEKICVPESFVAHKPESLSLPEAAAVPLVALTAWQALFDFAGLQEGQTVLIHGGAGGVGSFAVPLAKFAGCTVYTTASEANHEYLKGRGADEVLDYNKESVAEWADRREPGGFDFIFDCVGGSALEMSYDRVRPAGHLITIAAPIDRARCKERHVRCASLIVRPSGDQLREITTLIENGTLPLCAVEELPLEEVSTAFERSRAGHTRGKLVLKIS